MLALLANPGKVTTPGATVPASATSAQPGGGVNNAFLGQAEARDEPELPVGLGRAPGQGKGIEPWGRSTSFRRCLEGLLRRRSWPPRWGRGRASRARPRAHNRSPGRMPLPVARRGLAALLTPREGRQRPSSSTQQAPPQPQAYTSPPDLAQAYLALSQQNQAREGFWSGLSGVAAALHPGRVTPAMMKAIAGPQGQDAGSLFQNLMQMQQYQQQNQALQAYRQNVPGMLEGHGLN